MDEIVQGFIKALELIIKLDPQVVDITRRTLVISLAATIISTIICLPLACVIHFNRFPGKRILINLIQTFYAIPTVVVGLIFFLFFSRIGPLGVFQLMFTPKIMIIGQTALISPIVLGLSIAALSGLDKGITETAYSLGANWYQAIFQVIREARYAILSAIIMGFGRAISEVGLAVMIGGNIAGYTRVLTTSIAMEYNKGDIQLSIALGVILIVIALVVNVALNRLQQK